VPLAANPPAADRPHRSSRRDIAPGRGEPRHARRRSDLLMCRKTWIMFNVSMMYALLAPELQHEGLGMLNSSSIARN
jgi:hypothetical protein